MISLACESLTSVLPAMGNAVSYVVMVRFCKNIFVVRHYMAGNVNAYCLGELVRPIHLYKISIAVLSHCTILIISLCSISKCRM